MNRRKSCPDCAQTIYPTVMVPPTPDYWMRLIGDTWVATDEKPTLTEAASVIAYRCEPCRKSFRLVVPLPNAT